MTASLDSEAEVRITAHLPVSSQKSVNFEPAGYPLRLRASANDYTCSRRGSLFLEGPLGPEIEAELRFPELKRKPPLRSVNLVKGLPSPLLCAPAWRPAHLLGCSTSPRLAACLAAASSGCLPSCRLFWLLV
jgi:hypothetical protein